MALQSLCSSQGPTLIPRYREAELKHGRVAMLAAWGMITADKYHPLFGGKNSANPLEALTQVCGVGGSVRPSVV